MKLPIARNTDIIIQSVGNELLIYDLTVHKAYNLNETSKIVFNACDGKTSFDELKKKHKFNDDLIHFALDELRRENLVEGEQLSKFAGISRRDVIKKVGLATMIALPVITSITAPPAAHAQSGACGLSCINSSVCSAPCAACTGDGLCGTTTTACTNIGGGCTSVGTCMEADPIGTCSNNNGEQCMVNDDCLVNSTCEGQGTCS